MGKKEESWRGDSLHVQWWCPKSSFLFHYETCSKLAWDHTMSFSSTCSCFLAAMEKQSWSNKLYNCRQEAATSSSSLSLSTCYFNIISFFALWVSLWLIFSWMFLNAIQRYLSEFRLFDIFMDHVRDKGDHIIIHCSFKFSKKSWKQKGNHCEFDSNPGISYVVCHKHQRELFNIFFVTF